MASLRPSVQVHHGRADSDRESLRARSEGVHGRKSTLIHLQQRLAQKPLEDICFVFVDWVPFPLCRPTCGKWPAESRRFLQESSTRSTSSSETCRTFMNSTTSKERLSSTLFQYICPFNTFIRLCQMNTNCVGLLIPSSFNSQSFCTFSCIQSLFCSASSSKSWRSMSSYQRMLDIALSHGYVWFSHWCDLFML